MELERFLDKCRRYFCYFFDTLGGTTMTPLEIRHFLEKNE
jgi:hypothetical protein